MQCETRHISRTACPGAFIPEAELEQIVIGELRTFNQQLLDLRQLERFADFESALNTKKQRTIAEITRLRIKVDECNGAIKQLYADKTAGIITFKDYLELSAQFQADKARYENRILDCEAQTYQMESNLSKGDHRTERLELYMKLEHLSRGIVVSMIDRIEVGKRNRETGCVPTQIKWKF